MGKRRCTYVRAGNWDTCVHGWKSWELELENGPVPLIYADVNAVSFQISGSQHLPIESGNNPDGTFAGVCQMTKLHVIRFSSSLSPFNPRSK